MKILVDVKSGIAENNNITNTISNNVMELRKQVNELMALVKQLNDDKNDCYSQRRE